MTNAIALGTIAEKITESSSCCCCNWKDIAILVATVAGVAISIFTESVFGVIGFALAGAVVLIKLYQNTDQFEEMQEELTDVLEKGHEKFAETTDQMEKQVHQIQTDRDQYKKTVEELSVENQKLLVIQQGLKDAETQLTQDTVLLTQSKAELQHNLEIAQENARQIRTEVQAIIAENLRFGTTAHLFDRNVQALADTKLQLEQQLGEFDQEFDDDIDNLVKHIHIAKETSKALADSAIEQSEQLEQNLRQLREEVDQKQAIGEQLRGEIEAIDETRILIEQKTLELTEKETQLRVLEREIGERRRNFEETILKDTEALQHERETLEKTAQKLEETVRLKVRLIDTFDQKIQEKRNELNKLKSEIRPLQ